MHACIYIIHTHIYSCGAHLLYSRLERHHRLKYKKKNRKPRETSEREAYREGVVVKYLQVTHTHTHRQRTTPPTHTRQEQHPKPPHEHSPQTLNNARKWRDDGAYHFPRPGGWLVVKGLTFNPLTLTITPG